MIYEIDCYPDIGYMKYNKLFDCIVADPPYNKCIDDEFDNQWATDEEYLYWLTYRLQQFYKHLSEDGNLILYCKRQLEHKIKNILETIGFLEQRTIIWSRKRAFNSTRGKTLSSGYEPILWYSKSNNFIFNNIKIKPKQHLANRAEYKSGNLKNGICLSDVWDDIPALTHNSKEKVKHPTQKPLILSNRIIKQFSKREVFIPFAGSGSEIEACILNNRNYLATEKNKKFIKIINKRIEKYL